MSSTPFLLLLLSWPFLLSVSALAPPAPALRHKRSNSPPLGFYDPRNNGGSWLTQVNDTFPAGLGEPINVVLLATSDSAVLVDQENNGGLRNYFLSFGFAGECLGQHSGSDQEANLGDGHGYLNETAVIRYDYGDPTLGTCKETVEGGNHFRYWIQSGSSADSGAVFLAVSYELPEQFGHDIIFNGYNLARDWLIGNATAQSTLVPTSNLTNGTTFSGQTSYGGYVYQTSVQYVSGYLSNTSNGINHYLSVGANGTNAVDGLVAMMNVKILTSPASGSTKSSSARLHAQSSLFPTFVVLISMLSAALFFA
ncbi:hypothetical protein DFH94DRAFT_780526 [Russula ochroleuca]|jgi:hypothetical protein|uniref:Uncharacterized protein n=1 Tax=Russula ochroleuca TaxID=152965 RepID=A0A9P5JW76_9AGAM|nr:hypothetical protein DFH94DRAFT_780526 [Russula ochroleuca]